MNWKSLKYSVILTLVLLITGCSGKYEQVQKEQFIGEWKLEGRTMFDGITVDIQFDEKGNLYGEVIRLNDNKFVKMFAGVGDLWVSDISRNSNFQFKLTEKKIARELFSLYGLGSSAVYDVEFIDENTIGLSDSGDPQKSSIKYIRIK